MGKKHSTPTHTQIVAANKDLLSTLEWVSPKFDDPTKVCWACGWSKDGSRMERAHIVPASQGGPSTPDNFFLLCGRCHQEQPDTAPREVQIIWLRQHEAAVTRSFRDMEPINQAVKRLLPNLTMAEAEAMIADLPGWLEHKFRTPGAAAAMNPATMRSNFLWSAVEFVNEWTARNRMRSV